MNYRYEPVLAHHGIKGMRWGIRRDKTSGPSQRKNRRLSKGNEKKAQYTSEQLAKRERTKTYAKRGAIAAAGILATSIGTMAISKLIDNRRNNPVNFKKNALAREYLKNSFNLPLLPRVSKPGKEMPTFLKGSIKPGASFDKLFE